MLQKGVKFKSKSRARVQFEIPLFILRKNILRVCATSEFGPLWTKSHAKSLCAHSSSGRLPTNQV
jgi:hypothetical protein